MHLSEGRLKTAAAYAKSVGIAADQLINAILGGRPSETLSVRAYRLGVLGGDAHWRRVVWVINKLFFWQRNHCRGAYAKERVRRMQFGTEETGRQTKGYK